MIDDIIYILFCLFCFFVLIFVVELSIRIEEKLEAKGAFERNKFLAALRKLEYAVWSRKPDFSEDSDHE